MPKVYVGEGKKPEIKLYVLRDLEKFGFSPNGYNGKRYFSKEENGVKICGGSYVERFVRELEKKKKAVIINNGTSYDRVVPPRQEHSRALSRYHYLRLEKYNPEEFYDDLAFYQKELGHKILSREEELSTFNGIVAARDTLEKTLLTIPFALERLVDEKEGIISVLNNYYSKSFLAKEIYKTNEITIKKIIERAKEDYSKGYTLEEISERMERGAKLAKEFIELEGHTRANQLLDISCYVLGKFRDMDSRRRKLVELRRNGNEALESKIKEIEREAELLFLVPYDKIEENVRLLEKHKKEYTSRKEEFASYHFRLVVSEAKRYRKQGLPFGDLVSEGHIGLIKAIDKFDPSRGNCFITFATWWVKQAIRRAIAEKAATIRVPLHAYGQASKIYFKINELKEKLRRMPTFEEISKELGNSTILKHTYNTQGRELLSFDKPKYDKEDPLCTLIADESSESPSASCEDASLRERIFTALDTLKPREREVIKMRYGFEPYNNTDEPITLEQVGRKFKVTRERIRQIEAKALKKLSHPVISRKLEAFLKD